LRNPPQFKRPVICRQDQDVPRRIQYRGADFAVFQMQLDIFPQFGIDSLVDVVRDVFPHVFAIQFHSALRRTLCVLEPWFSGRTPVAFAASSERGAAYFHRAGIDAQRLRRFLDVLFLQVSQDKTCR